MKKIFLVLTVIALAMLSQTTKLAANNEFDYSIKFPGDYHKSCPTCAFNKHTKKLSCICKSYWGRTLTSSINMEECDKPINNCHGKLNCGPCDWQKERERWQHEAEKYGFERHHEKDEL